MVIHAVCINLGIHGLGNESLNSPWKKLLHGKTVLSDIVSTPNLTKNQLIEQLMELLSDKTRYIDVHNVFVRRY